MCVVPPENNEIYYSVSERITDPNKGKQETLYSGGFATVWSKNVRAGSVSFREWSDSFVGGDLLKRNIFVLFCFAERISFGFIV